MRQIINNEEYHCIIDDIIYVEDKGEDMATIRINREEKKDSLLDPRFTLMEVKDDNDSEWIKKNVVIVNPDGSCLAVGYVRPIIKSDNFCIQISNLISWDSCREITEPTYRPYNNTDDLEHLISKVVKDKGNNNLYVISAVHPNATMQVEVGRASFSFKGLFTNFTFLDGSPCGVLEE